MTNQSIAANRTPARPRRLPWAGSITVLLMVVLTATASADPVNRKISGTMPSFGDVFGIPSAQISPDGQMVVYRADQDVDGVDELYSVPATGGVITKLNGPLVNGGKVIDFHISADSSRVVYSADQETDEVFELFVSYDVPSAPPAAPIYLPLIVRE